jgi:hypothetical protein
MLPARVPVELGRLQESADPAVYGRAVELVAVISGASRHVDFSADIDGDDIIIATILGRGCSVLKHAPRGRQASELFIVDTLVRRERGPTTLKVSYHSTAEDAATAMCNGIHHHASLA